MNAKPLNEINIAASGIIIVWQRFNALIDFTKSNIIIKKDNKNNRIELKKEKLTMPIALGA